MSAYIVKDALINSVVAYLATVRLDELTKLGMDLSTPEGRKILADKMFALNVEAIEARYGKGQASEFRPLNFKFQDVRSPQPVQAYKSLRCWIYQCSEGNVPENEFYIAMNRVGAEITELIVMNLPAYTEAKW